MKDSSCLDDDELKEGSRREPKAITQRSPPKNRFTEEDVVMRDVKATEVEKVVLQNAVLQEHGNSILRGYFRKQ